MGLTPDFITLISHNLYLRSSRLIDSQVQQAPALIQIDVHRLHRLLTGDLRNFEWVPEDRCVEGRPGLQLIIDSIFNCAYPYDIDWQTHRRFLKYLSLLKPKYVGQTPEFDLLLLLTLAVVVASPLRELATSSLRSFPGDNLRLGLYNSISIYVLYSQALMLSPYSYTNSATSCFFLAHSLLVFVFVSFPLGIYCGARFRFHVPHPCTHSLFVEWKMVL